MTNAQPHFFAILPGADLNDRISEAKARVRTLVGEQLYLSDPPHLTVFLACFQDRNPLLNALESLSKHLAALELRLNGWQVFEKDCLTGNHTLVTEIAEEDREILRKIQGEVLQAVAGHRDIEASRERYQAAWDDLTPERQTAVQQYGFPFIGRDWLPHFTIASIQAKDWATAFSELRKQPIQGTFADFDLALFALQGKETVLVQRQTIH